jgi:predicted small lipoprotein YifL
MNRPADMTRTPGATSAVARIVLMLMVAAMLAGCGKKGDPIPPPGEPNTFPRGYPHD